MTADEASASSDQQLGQGADGRLVPRLRAPLQTGCSIGPQVEKLQSLRGMVDLLPLQTSIWQRVEQEVRNQFRRAGVQEIRTPLLEPTELFCRGIGEATDVVGKEMYTFSDRADRSCTLRPEGTASVARAVIQHGLLRQGPQRLWYGGPMFRYERPQAGRQRQFHQIGLEFLGFADPRSDVEAIALAWDLLHSLNIQGLTLELNTLGSSEDRARYRDQLVAYLNQHRARLDPDSQDRLLRNPLRILDSKNPETQEVLLMAPTLSGALAPASIERFEQVKTGLDSLTIPYTLNPRLVRGLDYYTHTAFEITSTQLGAQATVCGGGRYDGLVEQLGGPAMPAIGWAVGMERLLLLVGQEDASTTPDLYVVSCGAEAETAALVLARGLRLLGLHVELDLSGASFGKQFKRAYRSGSPWAAVLGDREAERGVVLLKSLHGEDDELELLLTDLRAIHQHLALLKA